MDQVASSQGGLRVRSAEAFTQRWVEAWIAHDLPCIPSHYDEEVVLISPRASALFGNRDGVVRGKAELKGYFGQAIVRVPNLNFELDWGYTGVDSVVLQYHSHDGSLAAEYMAFAPNGLVSQVAAHYVE